MTQKKNPARDGAGAGGHSRKSTATSAQHARILAALALRPHTSYELRRLGCYQCPARILELRRAGHQITTHRVPVVDADGYTHHNAALYSLEGGK